jgi:hypothetical protein
MNKFDLNTFFKKYEPINSNKIFNKCISNDYTYLSSSNITKLKPGKTYIKYLPHNEITDNKIPKIIKKGGILIGFGTVKYGKFYTINNNLMVNSDEITMNDTLLCADEFIQHTHSDKTDIDQNGTIEKNIINNTKHINITSTHRSIVYPDADNMIENKFSTCDITHLLLKIKIPTNNKNYHKIKTNKINNTEDILTILIDKTNSYKIFCIAIKKNYIFYKIIKTYDEEMRENIVKLI